MRFFQFLTISILWGFDPILQGCSPWNVLRPSTPICHNALKHPARMELLPHTGNIVVAQDRRIKGINSLPRKLRCMSIYSSEIHRYFWNGYIIWSEDIILRGVCGLCKIDIFEYLSFYEGQLPSSPFLFSCCSYVYDWQTATLLQYFVWRKTVGKKTFRWKWCALLFH